MDKQIFIDKVRQAQGKHNPVPMPTFDENDTVSTTATRGGAKAAFMRNFTANHGDVFESCDSLVEFLKSKGCKTGVADAKLSDLFGLEKHFEISREFDRQNNPDGYDFGISKASFAIGENGAIVFKDSDTADRLNTIAPWIHVAVVDSKSIVSTLPEGLAQTVDSPYAVYVTGPSKTTDVEGVLVEGVHGPGVQAVLIV